VSRAFAIGLGVVLLAAAVSGPRLRAQAPPGPQISSTPFDLPRNTTEEDISRWTRLKEAARALPLATALGAALALRPRRKGTVGRSPAVVQTQIILAVIGALVMLVVGSSLARAFGVVGAAGLVRYRAKIEDPKDAGVMLSTLAVGLASGVGLYFLSVFAAAFIIVVLSIIEWFEPEPQKYFTVKIETKHAGSVQPAVEALLRRHRTGYELRTSSADELSFEVHLPLRRSTDPLSKAILALEGVQAVDWNEEKKKPQTAT
jgi:hypothetical protein